MAPNRPAAGFTLPELMVALALSLFVVSALITAQIFGLQLTRVSEPMLLMSEQPTKIFATLISDVRSAKKVAVGTGSESSFSAAAANAVQTGSVLQAWATRDTNVFVRYYVDQDDQRLKRINSSGQEAIVSALRVTNLNLFRCENHVGQVLTNSQSSSVIAIALDVQIPPSASYQFRTKVTRRLIE